MLIDSHCHLTDLKFVTDLDEVLKRAVNADVRKMLCIGTNIEDSVQAIELTKKHTSVYASVGIYPDERISEDVSRPEGDFRENLIDLAKNKKVVAIGECGLDYTTSIKRSHEDQKELFRKQIGTAIQLGLPLIIHAREANDDTLLELSHYKETGKLRGVFHCFVSDVNFAKKVLDLGFYISFTGNITYPSAKHLAEVINYIPKDKIMIETDSPYLPPEGRRGQRNEPMYVSIVATKLAQILTMNLKEIADLTTKNAEQLFSI